MDMFDLMQKYKEHIKADIIEAYKNYVKYKNKKIISKKEYDLLKNFLYFMFKNYDECYESIFEIYKDEIIAIEENINGEDIENITQREYWDNVLNPQVKD